MNHNVNADSLVKIENVFCDIYSEYASLEVRMLASAVNLE